ncbi:right-handed parallel beta-helix repeat-containing protein [Streptomyces sp. NPDC127039]|uniref:right-handed parallel beta-helix repeat-containing protein n=1 Tax=Streptomyces sp. NPDC127039 TaxID=3347115 RepID=UPI003648D4EA
MNATKGRHRRSRMLSAGAVVALAAGGAGIYLASASDDARAAGSDPVVVSTTEALEKAFAEAGPGTTIQLRAGTYYPDKSLKSQANGTAKSRITVTAFGAEKAIVDGSKLPEGDWLVAIGGDYWTLSDLTFRKSAGHGVVVTSSTGGVFRNLTTHDNGASGFTLRGDDTNDNLIENLDSYNNYDPENHGQNADGLAVKFGSGSNNRVVGARLFNNADDGVDLWHWESPVRIERSWAYGNGVNRWKDPAFEGNGNGFKLGGGGPAADHVVTDCAAWQNTSNGFTENSNKGALKLQDNTAYANGASGYFFADSATHLTRNLALENDRAANIGSRATAEANSWNTGESKRGEVPAIRGTDDSAARGPRAADGSLPRTDFLDTGTTALGADMNASRGTEPSREAAEPSPVPTEGNQHQDQHQGSAEAPETTPPPTAATSEAPADVAGDDSTGSATQPLGGSGLAVTGSTLPVGMLAGAAAILLGMGTYLLRRRRGSRMPQG